MPHTDNVLVIDKIQTVIMKNTKKTWSQIQITGQHLQMNQDLNFKSALTESFNSLSEHFTFTEKACYK